MCSAIVQKVTGETIREYLGPRLFEPPGIDSPEWGTNGQGITLGGFGLHLWTGDIGKFGQLLLQRGEWHGRQLVPREWIGSPAWQAGIWPPFSISSDFGES